MDPLAWVLAAILRGRLRAWWRALLIRLGIRRVTPRRGEARPFRLVVVPELPRDTGGKYRPAHRPQDPAKDPREPNGGESSSRGNDHGWSGCTMSAGADVLAYHTAGALTLWGGDLRHAQQDLEGGTDLVDLRTAWAAYGEDLKIRSGDGWSALREAHDAGRAIVVQGTGEVPGAGDFAGGHACSIGPETHQDGRWLFGDPLCTDWQWIEPGRIRDWAERWQSSVAFAVSRDTTPEPEPDKPPEPEPEPEPCYSQAEREVLEAAAVDAALVAAGDAAVGVWLDWLRAPRPMPADRWDRGAWADPASELLEVLELGDPVDPCDPAAPASWSRGRLPAPAWDALEAMLKPATWDRSSWRAAAWRG